MDMVTRTPLREPMAGIVLAGGLSQRMGRDKALLPWQGRTLLEHACGTLRLAGATRLWVSGCHPAFGGVPDRVQRCGPLGGLYSTMLQMPDGDAWVLPVDMPLIAPQLLARLADAQARCMVFDGYPLPMKITVDDNCRRLLAAMIADADGPRSLRALQQRLDATAIVPAAGEVLQLVNCNTPEQWKELAS